VKTITAAIAFGPDKPFAIADLELEAPHPDEVLVRIVATGICHTDISVKNQSVKLPLPMVLGHEGAGVVEAVGSAVTHLQPGDHVVIAGDSCGHCDKCQQSLPFYCDEFVTRNLTGWRCDGSSPLRHHHEPLRGRFVGQSSFASHSLVPARAAIRIDKDLPLELMGPLGCGLTTGAGTVLNGLRPPPGSRIVVFGCGTVGLAAVMGARLTGARSIIAVDPVASRREMALSVGATEVIDPTTEDVVQRILASTRGGADFSVECSGVAAVTLQAIACLGRPGMCAQVGAPPGGSILPVDMDHLGFGRGIKGVVMGDANPQTFVPYLAGLWRDGRLPFDRFVRYYPLDQINEAVADASRGDVIKPILRMP
jgi:aryl-alcohol dehydrogenase